MKVNLTPAEKLQREIVPVLDQLVTLMRDFDKDVGAPDDMIDADMRCRVVAGICHDLQLDPLTVATIMLPYLCVIEDNCQDCKQPSEAKS